MSFPSNIRGRGCSSSFPQPVSEDDIGRAQSLNNTVYHYNCVSPPTSCPRFEAIWYRIAMPYDICHHVFRWTTMPYEQVFQNGFQARPQTLENGQRVEDEYYFNLYDHVTNDGRPLAPSSERLRNHAFVSTTLNSNWCPSLNPGQSTRIYRYEIYAPGGIWVTETLRDQYPQRLRSQNEIAFVVGIAPQYVRSAQLFILENEQGSMYTRHRRANNEVVVNGNFNPQMDSEDVLPIKYPVHCRLDADGRRVALTIRIWRPQVNQRRYKREVSTKDALDWYADGVANIDSYISAAFRSSRKNEAYIFMGNEYVLLNYAPGTRDDRIVNGPLFICEGFPSLAGTAFGEYGIDCAFACHDGNEAFIFSGNLCARIDYAPGTRDDKILSRPMTITAMFPFFKDTIFEMGVDAAFEATSRNEAYLFKGNQYALINYNSKSLIAICTITEGFYSLKNTIFEDGVEAAFASHRTDEAYLFKGDQYALINFAPGTTDDYVIGGVKGIRLNWPSLGSILPRKNRGLDLYDDSTPSTPAPKAEGHDEL